jgi:hypothetical protein
MSHRSRSYALVLTTVLLAACDGGGGGTETEPPPPPPIVLQIVSGDGQVGLPGNELMLPLVVRTTRGGQPVANVGLTFAATDGSVNFNSQTTDANGEAGVFWSLPTDESRVTGARVSAKLSSGTGTDSVTFTARTPRIDEMDLVVADAGLPVKMLIYDRGAFTLAGHARRDFTDSVRVFRSPLKPEDFVAFTPGRAPLLVSPTWTAGRDTLRLQFATEVIRMPITIWVVQPPFDSTAKLVQRHLKGVVDSWEAQAGIGLRDVRIVDATAFPNAKQFQDSIPTQPCDDLPGAIGVDAGRLNAYYVGQPPLGSAAHCGGANMAVFTLAWERSPFILAHEIGHGFLGGHHETIPDNVMHFRGDGTRFSAGQIFRAHYSATSILNTIFNAHPQAERRTCTSSPISGTPLCPPTDFVLD